MMRMPVELLDGCHLGSGHCMMASKQQSNKASKSRSSKNESASTQLTVSTLEASFPKA
jgi:hypothetical protein